MRYGVLREELDSFERENMHLIAELAAARRALTLAILFGAFVGATGMGAVVVWLR